MRESTKPEIFYAIVFASLLIMAIASYSGPWRFDPGNIWGAWLFHPDLSILLTIMTVFVGFSFLCLCLYQTLTSLQWLIRPYSTGILWIFLFHTIVGYRLIQFLKPSLNLYVLYGSVLVFFIVTGWLIGRLVEYCTGHQLEFIVKKVKREGTHG
jgi:hypothetical protein